MNNEKPSKLAAAASAVTTINTAINLFNDYRERWNSKHTYTATVPEDAFIFRPLLMWVNEEVHSRAVRFHSTSSYVHKLYDSTGRTRVLVNGHELFVSLSKPALNLDGPIELNSNSNPFAKSLVFSTTEAGGIDALHRFLEELTENESKREREIYVYRPGSYGWGADDFTYRDIDSIFLPGTEKEDIQTDIESFLEKEERYHRMGVPWHRGYLLYGPPGNGKSSLTAGLAHQYKLNLYNMPLSMVKDDKTLAELVGNIEDNSILLIEDIDIFSKSMDREQAENSPTLAGLLNALDGVSTPNGLITFMTTNVPDALDAALIRPGRVDYRLELLAPVDEQIINMFQRVYEEPLGEKPGQFSSMAALANVFKRHPDDANLARSEVLTGEVES